MQPVIAQLFNNFSLICFVRVVRLCLNIQWFWSMINVLIMTAKFGLNDRMNFEDDIFDIFQFSTR